MPHERTKHIEVDCHFIHEKLLEKVISTIHVKSVDQLADSFPTALCGSRVKYIYDNHIYTYGEEPEAMQAVCVPPR